MQYRPEIDGLRTIAVSTVVLFHAGLSWMAGGYVGVDIFFVISGYLITTILLREMQEGRYSLLTFYERRARRILPALFVVLIACSVAAWLLLPQSGFHDFSKSLVATVFFASNLLFWRDTGYFATDAELLPLLHTWSLAVEEQYYIFFPPLLWIAMRKGYKAALLFIAAAAALSLAVALFGGLSRNSLFFLPHVRVWELLAGSLCAWVMLYHPRKPNQLLSILGLGLIAVSVAWVTNETPFPHFAALPVIGTALLILFAGPGTLVGRALSLKPMVAIGLVSYSAYLWHQPLFAFARIYAADHPPLWVMLGLSVLAFGLATLTWAWIEEPFRGRPARLLPKRTPLLATSAACILAFAAFGAWGVFTQGAPNRAAVTNLVPPLIDQKLERQLSWTVVNGDGPPDFDVTQFDPQSGKTRVLVFGDSHAKDLFNALQANRKGALSHIDVRYARIALGCHFSVNTPEAHNTCIDQNAKRKALFDDADVVLLAPRWNTQRKTTLHDLRDSLAEAMQARGQKFALVGNTAEFTDDGANIIARMARQTNYPSPNPFPIDAANENFYAYLNQDIYKLNEDIEATAVKLGVPYLDRMSLLCPEDTPKCTGVTPDSQALVVDYGHWSRAGAAYLGVEIAKRKWLEPALQ